MLLSISWKKGSTTIDKLKNFDKLQLITNYYEKQKNSHQFDNGNDICRYVFVYMEFL